MRTSIFAASLAVTTAVTLGLASGSAGAHQAGPPFGEPEPDPAGVIDLPAGYSYDVLVRDCVDDVVSTESGATFGMPSDFDANLLVRGRHGQPQLLNAHELTQPRDGDYQGDAGKCAVDEQATEDDGDSDGWGSVSRLTLGRDGTTVTKSELITTGLHNLCAGAGTPWGTFLVNEEYPFVNEPGASRSGWVWEVDPDTGEATRATGMGRFSHEQEARSGGAWYMTFDYFTNSYWHYLYKFVPDHQRDLSSGSLYGLLFDRTTNTGHWVGPLDPNDPEADMIAQTGEAPGPTNSFQKHEGMVAAKRGNGVVFSESGSDDAGRIWHLSDRPGGVTGTVVAEGDFAKMSHPDNIRYDRRGNLFIFEDNGSALGGAAGPDNEIYVLPKGMTGSENLVKFATVRGGGEGTGPMFSRNGKLLYMSIQDQEQPDGSESRVIAIRMPKSHGRGHGHGYGHHGHHGHHGDGRRHH